MQGGRISYFATDAQMKRLISVHLWLQNQMNTLSIQYLSLPYSWGALILRAEIIPNNLIRVMPA